MPSEPDNFSSDQLKAVFTQALEHPQANRDRFLAQECGTNESLRTAARELLSAHEKATGFLDRPTLLPTALDEPADLPAHIGPYTVIRLVGEGGFGSVFLAEQAEPVQRRVAVKVLKPGMDSRQILARFNAERQTLALMDHPNIARVIDAGTTDAGRPYFVMEYVDGLPITQYCDQKRMSADQRLELFATVCHAVQHAHQKGIIHRDLKPSNVMVTEVDGAPATKVIDFGVSKAIEQVSGLTMMTDTRQLIGTPEYMSPEQARLESTDVDTRSDVYSLGVLLYELLTGTTPFDSQQLRAAAMLEMQRLIREVEPPRPSTRLSQVNSLEDVAACRQTEPRKLASTIRGELDWIVMKCLEKDRARRYESAAALAIDIESHRSGQPVSAGPPGRVYRMQKFVRRNRLPVAAASLAAFGLTVGLIIAVFAWRQASIERDRAAESRDLAEQHGHFVSSMFLSIRPEVARGRDITVREVLDDAVARVGSAFRHSPRVEIEVRNTFGSAYAGIGDFNRARQQFEAAIALAGDPMTYDDPNVLVMYANYGDVLNDAGDQKEADKVLRLALDGLTRRVGDDDLRTLLTKLRLASLLFDTDQLAEAESLHNQIQEKLTANPSPEAVNLRLANFTTLATVKHQQGKLAEAEELYRKGMTVAEQTLGRDHPDYVAAHMGYSTLLRDQARFAEALASIEPAFATARRIFGDDHPNTLIMAHHVGLLLSANGRSEEAQSILNDALTRCRRVFGPDHPTTIYTWHDWFQIRTLGRKYIASDEDLAILQELIRVMHAKFGEDHRDTLMNRGDLARLLAGRGQLDEAIAVYSDVLARLRRTAGEDHHFTLSVEMRLGQCLARKGDYVSAEPLLSHVYEVKRVSGANKVDYSSAAAYGTCLTGMGKWSEAVPVLLESEVAIRKYRKLDVVMMRNVASALAKCYERLGQRDAADNYAKISQEMESQLAPAEQPEPAKPTH